MRIDLDDALELDPESARRLQDPPKGAPRPRPPSKGGRGAGRRPWTHRASRGRGRHRPSLPGWGLSPRRYRQLVSLWLVLLGAVLARRCQSVTEDLRIPVMITDPNPLEEK